MKDIWGILGIDPTSEVQKIKRAFAEKAKETHPEENPEGFRKLKEAYRVALQYAKTGKMEQSKEAFRDAEGNVLQWQDKEVVARKNNTIYVQKGTVNYLELDIEIDNKIRIGRFLEAVEDGFANWYRIDKEYWDTLYEHEDFKTLINNREDIVLLLDLFLEEKFKEKISKDINVGLEQIESLYEKDEAIKSKVNELYQLQVENKEYIKGIKKFIWVIVLIVLFGYFIMFLVMAT